MVLPVAYEKLDSVVFCKNFYQPLIYKGLDYENTGIHSNSNLRK